VIPPSESRQSGPCRRTWSGGDQGSATRSSYPRPWRRTRWVVRTSGCSGAALSLGPSWRAESRAREACRPTCPGGRDKATGRSALLNATGPLDRSA
jgi:hypothetical protein